MHIVDFVLSFPRELVDSLHQRNVKVFLISGGFRCIVEHVAAQLNIPQHHVYANRLKFYFNGERSSRKNHFMRLAIRSLLLLLQQKSFMPCDITHKCSAHADMCLTIMREWTDDLFLLVCSVICQASMPALMRVSPQPRVAAKERSSAF